MNLFAYAASLLIFAASVSWSNRDSLKKLVKGFTSPDRHGNGNNAHPCEAMRTHEETKV